MGVGKGEVHGVWAWNHSGRGSSPRLVLTSSREPLHATEEFLERSTRMDTFCKLLLLARRSGCVHSAGPWIVSLGFVSETAWLACHAAMYCKDTYFVAGILPRLDIFEASG